jgi:hypothetical protein
MRPADQRRILANWVKGTNANAVQSLSPAAAKGSAVSAPRRNVSTRSRLAVFSRRDSIGKSKEWGGGGGEQP